MIKKTEQKLTAFLPCRKGSERVINKNTKKFADIENGLISIKLNQLLAIKEIDEIFLSTNDAKIINYASSLNNNRIYIDERSESLCSGETSTDELIQYVAKKITNGAIIWTHVTSPFVSTSVYQEAIDNYYKHVLAGKYDSLMTVCAFQKFIWDANGPINYNKDSEKWPRTQTIQNLYEINSGIFMADNSIYKKYSDRIGVMPYLMKLEELTAFDIDWESDWILAEQIYLNKIAKTYV